MERSCVDSTKPDEAFPEGIDDLMSLLEAQVKYTQNEVASWPKPATSVVLFHTDFSGAILAARNKGCDILEQNPGLCSAGQAVENSSATRQVVELSASTRGKKLVPSPARLPTYFWVFQLPELRASTRGKNSTSHQPTCRTHFEFWLSPR